MFKKICIAIGVLFLFTACGGKRHHHVSMQKPQQKVIIEPQNPIENMGNQVENKSPAMIEEVKKEPKMESWNGYYFGILPCSDCNGIKTWLSLSGAKDETSYKLIQNYKQKINNSKGIAQWYDNDSILSFENKMIFVGEGFVSFIDEPSQMLKNQYTLEKLDVFRSADSTFYLSPKSMQDGTINGNKAWRFSGVENFNNNEKFASTEGTYILNCNLKNYNIQRVGFYEKDYAMGKVLNYVSNNSNKYSSIKSNSTFELIFQKYCNAENKE